MRKIIFILFVFGAFNAQADRPYGTAGCGVGSMWMGTKDNQIMAVTTNKISSQSFAISSGTSNCLESGTVKREKEVSLFIEAHHHQLASDASRGEGEALSTLASLLHCRDSKLFGREVKEAYSQIFSQRDPQGIEAQIRASVNERAQLQSTCG